MWHLGFIHKLAVCGNAERQHAEQAGSNGGGCAQAIAARLQEGHAEAAAGACLAHLLTMHALCPPSVVMSLIHSLQKTPVFP